MNTIWSTYIQKQGTLYTTRSIRFSDVFKNKYQDAFAIQNKTKILEIGCGPGALTESLARWYPQSEIFGIDRDSEFIKFATKKAPHINFSEGDVTQMIFEDGSFDVVISNTVAEHIEPSKFYGEQHRVLKDGGVCLVLSARRGINIMAPCVIEQSSLEKDVWNRVEKYFAATEQKYGVCAYPQSEAEMPVSMEKYGFRNVTTDYITINLTPDNPIYSKEMACAMINANRQVNLDSVDGILNVAADVVTADEVEELRRIINAKYDKRLELYEKGLKQWDTNVSVTMIMRGVK